MAVDTAMRLNRFGLERGHLVSTVVMLLAVFAPLLLWTQWNEAVSGEEVLAPGTVITLTATPPPLSPPARATVTMRIDAEGWTTDVGDAKSNRRTLIHYPLQLSLTAVAGVENIDLLFERQRRELASGDSALFTSSTRAYTTDSGLAGLWGDLTGESYSGALVVVGRGTAAAAVVVTAPLGRLDNEMSDIIAMIATLTVVS